MVGTQPMILPGHNEIEYIIIPFLTNDNLYKTKELIDSLGKYEYDVDETERTITLFGYR